MSKLLTDVADLAGYDEPVTAPKYLETSHIASHVHVRLFTDGSGLVRYDDLL